MLVENFPKISLLRRLVAIFYDTLLLFSILFFAAGLVQPLTNGKVSILYQLYLFLVCFLYFAISWKRGGQTIGMKSWRIKLQSTTEDAVTWQQVTIRFFMAIISWFTVIGFILTWHDSVSNTQLVLLPHKKKK
ncbi:RDD family protein [Candidatus Marithrix sp. Canyon 246]|uniref:RDD family protein n=1 Tax=Candidatus Marithrix sp. Canyon 246 TaxID=1827136 RepID=UPI00084A104B|nr:RDD family protein [Candidatus Marithrix sp. Canyon 246]